MAREAALRKLLDRSRTPEPPGTPRTLITLMNQDARNKLMQTRGAGFRSGRGR